LNREFSKEEVQMINEYMKKCSTSLVLKEMQIKTAVRFNLTLVSVAIFKSKNNNKSWQECSETGTLIHYWWECKLVQSLWKVVWRFLRKLKIELPYDSVILLLGIYPKERKSGHLHTNVYCTTVQ
jgi:hypothetical protein